MISEKGAVLHLSFDASMTTGDLLTLFTTLLATSSTGEEVHNCEAKSAPSVSIRWINDSSALAVLPEGAVSDSETAAAAVSREGSILGVTPTTLPMEVF